MNFKWKWTCLLFSGIVLFLVRCKTPEQLMLPRNGQSTLTGSEFYKKVAALSRDDRELLAKEEILRGNVPAFLRNLIRINVSISKDGKTVNAYYFVTPDYLSVGNNDDFARVPLTPISAQAIADSLHCFLPTRKIVNDIYNAAKVKLEPMPMIAYRDSALTFWHHHLIIEGQRKQRKGLIAGIKKDVVISSKVLIDPSPNRVAIYGWHRPDGKPIQPLYSGHVNWYVDYSHGVRLVYRTIYVDGKAMDYVDVLKDPRLRSLLCDEDVCDHYRY